MKRILALFLALVLALSFSAFSVFAEENSGTINESGLEYTLNIKTKKIHVPTCSSAIKTAEENKETYFGDLQPLLDQGYTICGTCKAEYKEETSETPSEEPSVLPSPTITITVASPAEAGTELLTDPSMAYLLTDGVKTGLQDQGVSFNTAGTDEWTEYTLTFSREVSLKSIVIYSVAKHSWDVSDSSDYYSVSVGEVESVYVDRTNAEAPIVTLTLKEAVKTSSVVLSVRNPKYCCAILEIEITEGESTNSPEEPSEVPSTEPSEEPSEVPSETPSEASSEEPSEIPSETPSEEPSTPFDGSFTILAKPTLINGAAIKLDSTPTSALIDGVKAGTQTDGITFNIVGTNKWIEYTLRFKEKVTLKSITIYGVKSATSWDIPDTLDYYLGSDYEIEYITVDRSNDAVPVVTLHLPEGVTGESISFFMKNNKYCCALLEIEAVAERAPYEEPSEEPSSEESSEIPSIAPSEDPSDDSSDDSSEVVENQYVLNIKTHKIHIPACSSAQKTSAANKATYIGDVQGLIEQGYTLCGICNAGFPEDPFLDPSVPTGYTTIYFDNSSYNWSKVYAYVYSGTTENAAWPGIEMDVDPETGYYIMDLEGVLAYGNVIFTEGENAIANRYPYQFEPGLVIDGQKMILSNSIWVPFTNEPVSGSATIYFDNTSYNWSKVYAYIYKGATENAAWPGVEMVFDAESGCYKMTLEGILAHGNVIFTESEDATANRYPYQFEQGLLIDGQDMILKNYVWTQYTDEPIISKPINIYFNNSSYNWSKVYAYVYNGSVQNAEWPGVEMAIDSETGYYIIQLEGALAHGNVIFSDGENSANRYPGDLLPGLAISGKDRIFTDNYVWEEYVPGGDSSEEPSEEPSEDPTPAYKVTVYFDNSTYNWSTVYAYVYNGGAQNFDWPGIEMTLDPETGYYKIDLENELAYGNVIFAEDKNATTNRYPGDLLPGLAISGKNMLFSADYSWAEYIPSEEPSEEPSETPSEEPSEGELVLDPESDLKEEDGMLTGVAAGETAEDIISQFSNADVKIFDLEGNVVDNASKVGTGFTVKLFVDGVEKDSTVIAIKGEVTGDGVIDTTDYIRIKLAFLGTYSFEGAFSIAADVDESNELDTTDYVRIKLHFLGTYNLFA